MQIAQSVPEQTLFSIISSIEPTPLHHANSGSAHFDLWDVIAYLFLLFPPSFHPAILQTRLPDIHCHRSCTIPFLPWQVALDDSSPERASLLTQVLSAAAVLAGGQPQLIWHPDSAPSVPPHLQLSRIPVPFQEIRRKTIRKLPNKPASAAAPDPTGTAMQGAKKKRKVSSPAALADTALDINIGTPLDQAVGAAPGSGAMLTRLEFSAGRQHDYVGTRNAKVPVCVLAAAVGQLRSLMHLEIRFSESGLSGFEGGLEVLWVALSELPSVTRLALLDVPYYYSCRNTHGLLHAIARMHQLEDLSLSGCIVCCSYIYEEGASGRPKKSSKRRTPQDDAEAEKRDCDAISGLGGLTRLTRLVLRRALLGLRCSAAAMAAIERLPALQDLDVADTSIGIIRFAACDKGAGQMKRFVVRVSLGDTPRCSSQNVLVYYIQ